MSTDKSSSTGSKIRVKSLSPDSKNVEKNIQASMINLM